MATLKDILMLLTAGTAGFLAGKKMTEKEVKERPFIEVLLKCASLRENQDTIDLCKNFLDYLSEEQRANFFAEVERCAGLIGVEAVAKSLVLILNQQSAEQSAQLACGLGLLRSRGVAKSILSSIKEVDRRAAANIESFGSKIRAFTDKMRRR